MGDGNDATGKTYQSDSGSILVFPNLGSGVLPAGKDIIAVKVMHRQVNGGTLGVFNGWCASYLRINNSRVAGTKAYKQDGYSDSPRQIEGPSLYKTALAAWTLAEINTMSADVGAAVGEIGPNTKNRWCGAVECAILIITEDNVPVPNTPFPASGQTIATSSVQFSGVVPATQAEQPVQAVFQVARDAGFTQDVRTFVGGANQSTVAGTRSYYNSNFADNTYTNLGPGTWALRMKGRDIRGRESAWGATTFFTITHTALPVPTLVAPAPASTSPTPYALRTARFTSQPSGDRMVGAGWRFSKDPTFATGVINWDNYATGFKYASAGAPVEVSYDPTPNPATLPGKNGSTVSVEDPSQYLSQGTWYAQVRATDVFGQVGAWSSNFTFTVAHKPVVGDAAPKTGASFDQALQQMTWTFTDPWLGDSQSAFQLIVKDASNTVLQNTGKVLSAVPRATVNVPSSGNLNNILNYEIWLWDVDDVKSAVAYTGTFRLSTAPIITVLAPTEGQSLITGQPEIVWSSVFARAGVTQKAYQLKFVRDDNGVVEFDTGKVLSTATSYLPPAPILKNLSAYQLQVTITDSEDLPNTAIRRFTTNYERPVFVLGYPVAEDYNNLGYVTVSWPSADPDPFFMEWRIYRRLKGTEEWILGGTVSDPEVFTFRDWLIAGAGEFEYAITQAAYRFGAIVESVFPDLPESAYIYSDSYWLIAPDREELNVRLHSVTGDKFTERRESSEYVIIGGGRRKNLGTREGKEGNLTATVRPSQNATCSQQLESLRTLEEENRWCIMRDPFGNTTKISLGEISADRIPGVGNDEFADLDIPYSEVM
ncbi:minor tail protein [Rhodococcus phage Mbo2]|uniref:Minor tail protein n=1 Tax=Rhodococcus phage Mbo2 TaxID=2936911 RepID=A0A9E7LH73_9CAUD|nr:minor tail protein [Rhodococcus phage Mbo2]